MSLLTPALLAGLGLLVVPVLIHLTLRHRSRVTPFPSLMFLRAVPFKTTSRRRIRHPLLFALRCLAIILIVFAFSRPFLGGGDASRDEARDVVILLDTSGSLGFADRRAAALQRARAVVDEAVEGDRVGLVTFNDRAVELAPLSDDPATVRLALDGVVPTDRSTRIETGLQLAARLLGDSDRALREIVLISDFQRTGWQDDGRTRLPDGVTLRNVDVGEGEGPTPNIGVADVQLAGAGDDRHRFVARVVNLGDEAVSGLPVTLELGGRDVATRPVDLEARGAGTVVFDDVPIPSGAPLGRVRVPPDGLSTDDELRFVAAPNPVLDVALLTGSGGRADRSLYLERALGLGDAPRVGVDRGPATGLDLRTLARLDAVILNDTNFGDAARVAALGEWVAGGGALLAILGPASEPDRWGTADSTLLGGVVGPVVDRASRGGSRISWIDYDHPIFEPFSTPRSGDFSAARFYRFRSFEPGARARVLARFEDGEPALVEHVLGEGRVLTWTSTLDRFWNDLALQPVFLPFVHRALGHVASYEVPERWLVSGQQAELAALLGGRSGAPIGGDGRVLVTPRGERLPIDMSGASTWIEFPEAGFYRIEAVNGESTPVTVAVNLPLAESDLGAVAPERVSDVVVGAGAGGAREASGVDAVASLPEAAADEERRRELWWPLLMLAAIVLGVESWVANRWSHRRGPVPLEPTEGRIG